jgi:DNA-binding beta-propeller fold protein YncE
MPRPDETLAFPGRITADPAGRRLLIADSGHHRLVVCRADGGEARVIGTGRAGFADGPAPQAQFHHPQGMALDGETLYVADTSNHAIRRVDLTSGQVQTIAGTGRLGLSYAGPGPARQVDLRSPWALALRGHMLYIAMAGMHQIWVLDLKHDWLAPYAGSGLEGIQGGRLNQAWFAQPSGLSTDGRVLYVACSETSAVRMVDLPPGDNLRAHRLVGVGLFDFGDVDGTGDQVRLQHPLDVAWHDGRLYVADSYNHKVKRLDPETRRCESWVGDGEPGLRDGHGRAARFFEPGGLSIGDGVLYVADTNNHAIRAVDLQTGAVTTLAVTLS